MSLVEDLISNTVDPSTDLSHVLRQAKLLASELKSDDFKAWTDAELNGYGDTDVLPEYRLSVGMNRGNFVGIAWKGAAVPIPLAGVPERWHDGLSKLRLRNGVAGLQEMLRSDKDYSEVWPADAVVAVSRDIYQGMTMTNAWKVIPKATIVEVLDAVRNRLLDFLLDLREQHPDEVKVGGERLKSIPADSVRTSVVNIIYGGSNVLASGENVLQDVAQGVTPGDLGSLLSALREASVPEELIDELPDALDDDPDEREHGLGPKMASWLAKASEKVATGAAGGVVAQAVLRFYGLVG